MKKILVSILSVLYIAPALAADLDAFKAAWGVGSIPTCGGISGFDDKKEKDGKATCRDGNAIRAAWIARKVVDKGGEFCRMWIKTERPGYVRPWTEYHMQLPETCLWLCEDGFYGENCASKTPTSCREIESFDDKLEYRDPSNFSPTPGTCSGSYGAYMAISNVTNSNASNIEDIIPMFVRAHYEQCYGGGFDKMECVKQQEHDMLLGARRTDADQTTFEVQPLVVRAGCFGIYHISWPVLSWAGQTKILCPDGYRLNSAKTKCEQVSNQISDICSMEKLCATTPRESYVEGMHSIISDADALEGSDCSGEDVSVFRCASSGQGFKAKNDFECIDCPNPRQGVGKDGVCKTCETGEIFDTNEEKCVDATALSQTAMRIGPKTEDSDKLADQCWIKDSPTEYKSCILNGNTNNNTDTKSE